MDILNEAFLNLRIIKLRRFLGSLFYPLQRDWLEHQFRKSQTLEAIEETGEIQRAEATKRGGQFHFKHIELEIYFLSADLVRIEWKPGIYPISYGISRKDWPEVETTFQERETAFPFRVAAGIARGVATAAGLESSTAVQIGVDLALSRPHSRQDEFEADQRGLRALGRAGYAQSAMIAFMQKLLQQRSLPTFLSTHPATSDV